jgi:hypothetical protein
MPRKCEVAQVNLEVSTDAFFERQAIASEIRQTVSSSKWPRTRLLTESTDTTGNSVLIGLAVLNLAQYPWICK